MKLLIVSVVMTIGLAKEMKLKFQEKGKDYIEKINIDNTTVEIDVPEHTGLQEAKYLNDYKVRLVVMKLDRLKICYAYNMAVDEFQPDEIVAGVKKFNNTFPDDEYTVLKRRLLPLRQLDARNLTNKIKDFCGNYSVIKVAQFQTLSELETAVAAKKRGHHRTKRQIQNAIGHVLCNALDLTEIIMCLPPSTGTLQIRCILKDYPTCIYHVACTANLGISTHTCGRALHRYNLIICCHYKCQYGNSNRNIG